MPSLSVFFDTNVLVYPHDKLSPYHEKSSALLDLALDNEIMGIIIDDFKNLGDLAIKTPDAIL